jgi:hypothetical protein
MFFGTDKEYDIRNIKKGFGSRLHIFRAKEGVIENVKTVHLPFPDQPQLYYTPDYKKALLNGKRGTQYILLDLETGKYEWVFRYVKGQPGFRGKGIVQWLDGSFYVFGYAYDKNQKKTFEGLARVDLDKINKPEMFVPVMDFEKVKKLLKLPLSHWTFAGPDLLHVASRGISDKKVREDAFILYHTDGKELKYTDTGWGLAMVAAAGKRFCYAAKRKGGVYEVVVKDLGLKKTWVPYHGALPMHYLYISSSNGGKTILSTDIDLKSEKMTLYYGHEGGDFKLKPVPSLKKVPIGALRMSDNGRWYLFLNKDGLRVGSIPEE